MMTACGKQDHEEKLKDIRNLFYTHQALIIDIQYVLNNKTYFIKEMSILEPNSFTPEIFLFKPPYVSEKTSKQQRFVTEKINGLRWVDGDLEFNKIGSILTQYESKYSTFIVKGRIKQKLLVSYLSDNTKTDIIDLEHVMPAFKYLPFYGHMPCTRFVF